MNEEKLDNIIEIALRAIAFAFMFTMFTIYLPSFVFLVNHLDKDNVILSKSVYCRFLIQEQQKAEEHFDELLEAKRNFRVHGFHSLEHKARFYHHRKQAEKETNLCKKGQISAKLS